MRRRRLAPVTRVPRYRPSFKRELARARVGGARGYTMLGAAVAERVLAEPSLWLGADEIEVVRVCIDHGEIRALVRLFVWRIRWLMRHVPYERRYTSFARGVANAVATSATTWSQNPRSELHSVAE